jgi:2-hydroxy-3-keto-5-methylthiopentenyl-1-phosphate phosphatase
VYRGADTVVLDNTARQLFERFLGPEGWAEHETRRRAGLTVEQTNAASLAEIDPSVTREEIEEFALQVARPREGLLELADWTHWNGWVLTIISLGFDLYVDPVLDHIGLTRASRHMGRTRNEFRWRVRYSSPRGIEIVDGFKVSYAQAFRSAGDFVVYAGDGESDVEAARMASAVFARSTLWERLKTEHPRIYPFETFHDVVAVLNREAAGWLKSFPGS